jgi:uncharacterized protein YkwD
VCLRAIALAAVLVALLAMRGVAAPPAGAVVNCTIETSMDSEERAFLVLLNNHRAANGLAPLGLSYKLSHASQWKSNDLGVNAYFAHDDLNRPWVQRIRDCGYGYNTWLGENIAGGVSDAQSAFNLWKNSIGHNANMLGANYTTVGIGRAYVPGSPYGWYWTTDFGGINDGWSLATSPSPAEPHPVEDALTLRLSSQPGRRLELTASANAPSIVRVDFLVDGALVRSDRQAPFTATWRGAPPREIRAVGYDARRHVVATQIITAGKAASR